MFHRLAELSRPSKDKVIQMVKDTVAMEISIMATIIPVVLIKIDIEQMKQYIEFVADSLLKELNFEKVLKKISWCTNSKLTNI